MKFLRLLSAWAWVEIAVILVIFVADNFFGFRDGLWLSLIIALTCAVPAIVEEIQYEYSLAVNHPEQYMTDKQVRGSMVRTILSTFLCIAPLLYGELLIKVLSVFSLIICVYGSVAICRLHAFVSTDVKYGD